MVARCLLVRYEESSFILDTFLLPCQMFGQITAQLLSTLLPDVKHGLVNVTAGNVSENVVLILCKKRKNPTII